MTGPSSDDVKRLGRAVVFVHQHDHKIVNHLIRAEVEVLLLTGKAMDFAARLKGHGRLVEFTHELVVRYGNHAGLGKRELFSTVLPELRAAELIDYSTDSSGNLTHLEEFVGVSQTVTEQTVALLNGMRPERSDLAFLHSVEISAVAPLAESQHLQEIVKRGFSEAEAENALRLGRATGIILDAPSVELGESVVYSPYVWGTRQLSLAKFLAGLPANERDALLGMSQQVLETPGIQIAKLQAPASIIRSAQSSGLIQAATVQSASGASSTYVFSPLLEMEDNQVSTTEALHLRKLFVAHILFGHKVAKASGGQIQEPATLVRALVNRGRVGPATNISTDYHLLEAAGVVAVEPTGDRAYLRLIKPEIAETGLEWVKRIKETDQPSGLLLSGKPSAFVKPEDSRSVEVEGAAREVLISSIHELRKEMQRATRREDPWA